MKVQWNSTSKLAMQSKYPIEHPQFLQKTVYYKCVYIYIIGASLSEPYTSVTAYAEVVCMYVCIYVCMYVCMSACGHVP